MVTTLVSVVVVGMISICGMWYLRRNSVAMYEDLSVDVSTNSENTFIETVRNNTLELTKKKAELTDVNLSNLQNIVMMLAQNAEDIIQNPEYYNPRLIANNSAIQLMYAENLSISDIEADAALMSNLQGVLLAIIERTDNVTATYIGAERGYFIIADDGTGGDLSNYDPRERQWYIIARQEGRPIWTNLYEDAYGHGLMVTCAMPFYDENGDVAGVVGIDALLTDLDRLINEEKSWQSETSFLLDDQNKTIITGDIPEGAPWNDIWEFLSQNDEAFIRDIAQNIADSASGCDLVYFMDTRDERISMYTISYTTIETVGWRIITLIDYEEIFGPVETLLNNIDDMTGASLENFDTIILTLIGVFAVVCLITATLISLISRRFTHSLTKPILILQDSVADMAGGNLNHRINISTGDEIEDLGLSVNKMALDLKEYIANLQKVTAEKERIGAELSIATQIQADMLPSIFPPFPEREEFDIFAIMQPAKEVGGDFYDFFLIDDNHLGIVMADVSGKSIPAALFMVIAKTLINNRARNKENPQDVFINVNNQLREGNETAMFVTAWFGVLEISSGKMTYVNAGHNPPLLKRAGSSFEYLKTKRGFMLAGMENYLYTQQELHFGKGDMLYLYTDGVTEANNAAEELYGEERLKNTLNDLSGLPPAELLPRVKADIDLFACGAPQFDDITMLAISIL